MKHGGAISAGGVVAVYLAGLVTYALLDPWSSSSPTKAASSVTASTVVESSTETQKEDGGKLSSIIGPVASARSPEAGRLAALGAHLNDYWTAQFAVPLFAGKQWRPIDNLYVNVESGQCEGATELSFHDYYCPSEHYVELAVAPSGVPGLATPARNFIIAHEWGHAVQASAKLKGADKQLELQADCFAGAFLRHAADSGILTGDDVDIAAIHAAIRLIGDDAAPGLVQGSEHGTGAERIAHFDIGWNVTTQACLR
jgi:predicted metalloprotease